MSKNHLAALPLGGVGEIGHNMMVYECNGDMIVVDAGVSFGDETEPGVDIIVPDTRYLREHAKAIKGIFITHGHEDHIGAVGYLWDDFADAKVYVTPFARQIVLGKLAELGINPGKGQIVTVKPGSVLKPSNNFEVEFVAVAHSVPECFALAIKTPYGTIVHTGDYKFDDAAYFGHVTDVKRFKEIGKEGVLAVFGDSTNAFKHTESLSEKDILPHIEELIKNAERRVFFASFASNIGRILTVAQMAAKYDRKVCFLGRTVNKMVKHCRDLGYFPKEIANHIVEAEDLKGLKPEKTLVFASGTQGEGGASLTRLAQGMNVRGLTMEKGDTVILSSKMIPGNERGILDVINGIYMRGALLRSELNDQRVHVSGHGGRPDMKRMYEMLKPTFVVPVHGEPSMLLEHRNFANELGYKGVNVFNGQKLVLAEEKQDGKEKAPYVQKHAYPHGKNYIDGLNILENDPVILKERRKLSYDGVVSAAIAVRQDNGEWNGDVSLTTRGIIDEALQGDVLQAAQNACVDALERVFANGRIDDYERAGDVVTQTLRRAFKLHRGKNPTIMVQVAQY